MPVEQPDDVRAGRTVRLPDGNHLPDLGQRQTGGLGGPDEGEPVDSGVVVVAVPGRRTERRG